MPHLFLSPRLPVHMGVIPLDTGKNGCHVISWAPTVLQNVQTKLARPVDIWVKHLADKLDAWGFVWVLLLKVHDKTESAIFEGSISGADDDGVPKPDQL